MIKLIAIIKRRYEQWREEREIRKIDEFFPPKSQALTNPIIVPSALRKRRE